MQWIILRVLQSTAFFNFHIIQGEAAHVERSPRVLIWHGRPSPASINCVTDERCRRGLQQQAQSCLFTSSICPAACKAAKYGQDERAKSSGSPEPKLAEFCLGSSKASTWLFFLSTLQPWNVPKWACWHLLKQKANYIPTNKQLCSSSICILPYLWSHGYPASREMSLFSVAPGAALSSAVQISVCLILTAPIHHCRARRLSPKRQTTANKATFLRDGCSPAPLLSSLARFCFLCTSFVCFNSLIQSVCKLLSVSVDVCLFIGFRDFTLSLSFCSPLPWL